LLGINRDGIEDETLPDVWLRPPDCLLKQSDYSTHSMILGIQRPDDMTAVDFRIFDEVDRFLRAHNRPPIVAVRENV
jgi:hypothetical protein